jgi:dTDP-4-dehydrorhamnose 3,5-epimerase
MSTIEGVLWGSIRSHPDERGAFRELWRASLMELEIRHTGLPEARFCQANLSTSAAGVLRGMHYHRRQLDYWIVLAGRVFVALVDLRQVGSGRLPITVTRELAPDETVIIPAGVAHGFLALEATQLLYLVTNEYDGTDELGFAWDDPTVAIPWPRSNAPGQGSPLLSPRDQMNPSLATVLASARPT